MKNVLVLEDEKESNQFLCSILSKCREEITIYSAYDEREAIQLAMDCFIDLFLIDISLRDRKENDFSGFTFAKRIRRMQQYEITPLIFITSIANLELHTYREVSCFNYILKPITPDKQKQILCEVERLLAGSHTRGGDEFYYFKIDNVYHPVKIEDIVFVQCEQRQLKVHTRTDIFMVSRLTMKQLIKDLNRMGNNPFVECRRGFLVNFNYVENIDVVNKYLKLFLNNEKIDIGNSKWLSRVRGIIHYDK